MKATTAAAVALFLGLLLYIIVIRRKKPAYFTIDSLNAANSRGQAIPAELLPNAQILLEQLNIIQDELYKIDKGYTIKITSAYRSPEHNAAIGGAQNSKHMQAKAVDFQVEGLTAKAVQNLIVSLVGEGKIKNAGLGRGETFTHYDYRDTQNISWAYVGNGGSNTYSIDFAAQRRASPATAQLTPIATKETLYPSEMDI